MKARGISLPDTLQTQAGQRIETAEQWQTVRRPEILDLFKEHVYGRAPEGQPTMKYAVEEKGGFKNGTIKRKKVDITIEGPYGQKVIQLLMFLPSEVTKPLPTFLLINNRTAELTDPELNEHYSFWPADDIVARGYAAAVFHVADVDPDQHDEFKNGVHGIFDNPNEPRPANAWGTIAAWAWGASRVLDYFETDEDIDAKRVAVVGHSRGGKTALWAGATDERFAMVVSNNSGCTGAAIARGTTGEKISDINKNFPHWFNENYKQYNERVEELPVDQHMLVALAAPRLVYVSSASEDAWADPEYELLSVTLSDSVYRLFGYDNGLGPNEFPEPQTTIHADRSGYHLREGKHNLTDFDWKCFMDFADQRL